MPLSNHKLFIGLRVGLGDELCLSAGVTMHTFTIPLTMMLYSSVHDPSKYHAEVLT